MKDQQEKSSLTTNLLLFYWLTLYMYVLVFYHKDRSKRMLKSSTESIKKQTSARTYHRKDERTKKGMKKPTDERKYESKKEANDKLVKVPATSRHTLYFVEPVSFLSSATAVALNRISSYLSSKASYKDKTRILRVGMCFKWVRPVSPIITRTLNKFI